ncbi:S8 family peptidase [Corynebacterium coyleae]|uniref:S8 family peptidase n=1 Tax=Corynebacterium coyleae TaxID=53374 RepID=UPI00254D2748|nr:S8 family peptidase [Corynebacterium coyleae]MDK6492785.1 S8 family peptidase [Corynebacterium coyleae]
MNERYVLGNGEALTYETPYPGGGKAGDPPYSFEEAIERVGPMVRQTASELFEVPSQACPRDEVVAAVTLHPQGIAKSYHPRKLLDAYNLRQVGSRPVSIRPDKWSRKNAPEISPTTELYVAGKKNDFASWAADFEQDQNKLTDSIQRVERVRALYAQDRIRHLESAERNDDEIFIELLIHASREDTYVISGLEDWATEIDAEAKFNKRLFAGGLCFIPAKADKRQIEKLAEFSFLRSIRPLSQLRNFPNLQRSSSRPDLPKTILPKESALDPSLNVAIFDGGLPEDHQLDNWVESFDPPSMPPPESRLQSHGHDVTSAILFGSLSPGQTPQRPYCNVDHYRVLGEGDEEDPYELYNVLQRISSVLSAKHYDFVNLSLGPAVCIEDEDVHPWTAILDSLLSEGQTLMTIAAGNNGDALDRLDRRVQVPSDCVNAIAIGAANSTKSGWDRAAYSAIGPGRTPGIIKPDLLDFGGTYQEPFYVSDRVIPNRVATTLGTSFAAPSALRQAVGLRALYGDRLSPLALKALLIHTADANERARKEVGWGRVAADLNEIMQCKDGQVRIIYQGELEPSRYLRAPIPLPTQLSRGLVNVKATVVYACEVDPEDPGNYSRSGLDVVFRPDETRFENENSFEAKSRPFFRKSDFDSENLLRSDAHKWETTLNSGQTLRTSSLHNPVFDIHYNARTNGGNAISPTPIPYALVITVEAKSIKDLYERVAQTYSTQLRPILPVRQPVTIEIDHG